MTVQCLSLYRQSTFYECQEGLTLSTVSSVSIMLLNIYVILITLPENPSYCTGSDRALATVMTRVSSLLMICVCVSSVTVHCYQGRCWGPTDTDPGSGRRTLTCHTRPLVISNLFLDLDQSANKELTNSQKSFILYWSPGQLPEIDK